MKRSVIVIPLVFLAFPGIASAHRHRHHRHRRHHHHAHVAAKLNPVPVALDIAFRYWKAYPCGGDFRVVDTTTPANDEAVADGQPAMWSSWESSAGPNNEDGQQPFSHCVIGINSNVWTSERFAAYTAWPEFSMDMIHEVGHLLGHAHSSDSSDVMYPEPSARTWLTGGYAPGWG